MSSLVPAPSQHPQRTVISLISEQGGARASMEMMARCGPALGKAVRRSVPFFTRRSILVKAGEPRLVASSELLEGAEAPAHVTRLVSEPGGARAALVIDGPAITFLLEGSLGGDGSDLPKLDAAGLSSPQSAFVSRIAEHMTAVIAEGLQATIGMRVMPLPGISAERAARTSLIALPITLHDEAYADEGPTERGTITLAISKHALLTLRSHRTDSRHPVDSRMARALEQTDIEVVAELGRLQMTIADLAALRVGDTLRLPVAVNGAISLRVEDQALFMGHPTTAGTQLAVRLLAPSNGNADRTRASRPPAAS